MIISILLKNQASYNSLIQNLKFQTGGKLKNLMVEKNLKREDIAALLGFESYDSVTNITSGKTMMSISDLILLCTNYNLPLDYFIDLNDEMFSSIKGQASDDKLQLPEEPIQYINHLDDLNNKMISWIEEQASNDKLQYSKELIQSINSLRDTIKLLLSVTTQ